MKLTARSLQAMLCALFFLSGFASLVYQVAWNKVLTQTVGSDHLSVALVVSIFMLGLGIGGHFGARITKKWSHSLIAFPIAASIVA